MYFYRQVPTNLPPSQASLKFWLDAQDLSVPDGTIVTTMNNKGTLGGTFIDRSTLSDPYGMGFNGQAAAATVDGKRALSYEPNKTQSFISSQNISTQTTITVLTVTANQGNKIPGSYGAPFSNTGVHCSISDFYIRSNEAWGNYPYDYGNNWYTSATSVINTTIDAGSVSAIVVQYDATLATTSTFNKVKKDAADYSTAITPNLTTINSGPMVVGGFLTAAGAGGYLFSFAGKIYEMLVWEGIVDVASIKTYLDQKYGGTW